MVEKKVRVRQASFRLSEVRERAGGPVEVKKLDARKRNTKEHNSLANHTWERGHF